MMMTCDDQSETDAVQMLVRKRYPDTEMETCTMKVVIRGLAVAFDEQTEELIADGKRLAQLDGLSFSEEYCGDYLSDSLFEIGIVGGLIELSYSESDSKLEVLTTYRAPRELTPDELKALVDETLGQWSDGIGEGEFQHSLELGMGVDISATTGEPTVEQIDDGIIVKRPKKSELIKLLQSRRVDESQALELVQGGADVHAKDRYGQTVLELACLAVLPKLVELLVQRGVVKNASGDRSLSKLAFCHGSSELQENSVLVAEILLESGISVDGYDEHGRTPLMMAANRNNLPLVKCLLGNGADINARDADEHNGLTVLMYAQHLQMTQYLLENGADPNIRTAYGENAFEYQARCSHQEDSEKIAALIKRYLH